MLLLVVVLPVPCPGAPPEDRPVSGSRGPTLGETPAPEGLAQGGPFLPEGRTSFRAHSENEAEMKQVPAGDVPTSIQVFGKRWPSTGAGQALGPVAGVSQGRPTSEGRTTVQVQQFLQHQRTEGAQGRAGWARGWGGIQPHSSVEPSHRCCSRSLCRHSAAPGAGAPDRPDPAFLQLRVGAGGPQREGYQIHKRVHF